MQFRHQVLSHVSLPFIFMSLYFALLARPHQWHCISAHDNGQQRFLCTLMAKGEASDLLVLDADRFDRISRQFQSVS